MENFNLLEALFGSNPRLDLVEQHQVAVPVGEILAVSGDTFTSRQGAWIYTWDKEGKKISTRAAK